MITRMGLDKKHNEALTAPPLMVSASPRRDANMKTKRKATRAKKLATPKQTQVRSGLCWASGESKEARALSDMRTDRR